MITALEIFAWAVLGFIGICFAVYTLSIFQMKAWLHEIKNFLEIELRNYKLKEQSNEDKKE